MATISFWAGENNNIANLAGSGLGFYGGAFGYSVAVGTYQQTTYITNAAGTAQGPQCDNVKYVHPNSGLMGSNTVPSSLLYMPNSLATLNIRFDHTSAVKVQNVEARVYDRYSISNPHSGVTVAMAELIHPSNDQTVIGSGDSVWCIASGTAAATGIVLSLAPSPGSGGIHAGNGSNSVRTDTVHDWFMAISASPDSIGSKTQFGLYVSLEYL
jgi:hypothetical protein